MISYVICKLLTTLTIKNTTSAIALLILKPNVLLSLALYKYQLVSIIGTVDSNIYACAIVSADSLVIVRGPNIKIK